MALFSLFFIFLSFSLIVYCSREIDTLRRMSQARSGTINTVWEVINSEQLAKRLPPDLNRYDVKVNLVRPFKVSLVRPLENYDGESVKLQFCDKYSLILFRGRGRSGVYYNADQDSEKYVSTTKYPRVFVPGETFYKRLKGLRLSLECDLRKKTAAIFLDEEFIEKVYLGPEPASYRIGLEIRGTRDITLNKLEISDRKGKSLFCADYFSWFLYKLIAQGVFSLGVLIFLVSACSEKIFFRRMLLFVISLFFIEAFLRVAYKQDPSLDIERLKYKWQFEATTNLLGDSTIRRRSRFGLTLLLPRHFR